MLEIKNGTLSGVEHPATAADINLVVDAGEMLCIYAWSSAKRQAIVHTLLGLQPLKSGFMSVDGDVIDERSAAYYRNHTAFVPRDLRLPFKTVGETMQAMMTVDKDLTKGTIESEWRKVGIADGLWNALVEHIGQDILQQMMMVIAVMRGCNHMIIDLLPGAMTPEMMDYLRQYTSSGGLIVIATDDEEVKGQCDKSLLEP
jgi:hypothetical protein